MARVWQSKGTATTYKHSKWETLSKFRGSVPLSKAYKKDMKMFITCYDLFVNDPENAYICIYIGVKGAMLKRYPNSKTTGTYVQ